MGALRVGAGGERLVERNEAEQAALELGLVAWRCRAGQDRQAVVDLERVRGDRDGVLTAGAQRAGEGDGDRRLADARRAEDGDDLHGGQVWLDESARTVSSDRPCLSGSEPACRRPPTRL